MGLIRPLHEWSRKTGCIVLLFNETALRAKMEDLLPCYLTKRCSERTAACHMDL